MLSPLLIGAWVVLAFVLQAFPSNDNHWRRAYVLIAFGIPILGYVTYQNGPWLGLAVLLAGMSLLRWPVIYLTRWIRGRVQR